MKIIAVRDAVVAREQKKGERSRLSLLKQRMKKGEKSMMREMLRKRRLLRFVAC